MQDASTTTDLENKINLNVLFRLNSVTAGSGEFEAAPKDFAKPLESLSDPHDVLEDPRATEEAWRAAYEKIEREPAPPRHGLQAILNLLRSLTDRL